MTKAKSAKTTGTTRAKPKARTPDRTKAAAPAKSAVKRAGKEAGQNPNETPCKNPGELVRCYPAGTAGEAGAENLARRRQRRVEGRANPKKLTQRLTRQN